MEEKSLGCGKMMEIGHKCGVANANGKEHLCKKCDAKMRESWKDDK